jgi:hypothetical protein
MRPVKAKPKKKSRVASKSSKSTKAKRKTVAPRKVAAKPKRKVVAKAKATGKPKRKTASKAKAKAAPKPKRTTVAKAKPAARPKRPAVAKAKPAPKPRHAPAPKATAAPAVDTRRDGTGHLSKQYAADLRERSMESAEPKDAPSFVEGTSSGDPLAEELGEDFVQTALSGEDTLEESLDQVVSEERGGPFIESTGGTEFAEGTDASNPKGAKREPFPTT